MTVKINIPHFLQHLAGNLDVAEVSGNTVGECLDDFVRRFPQTEKLIFDKDGMVLKYIDVFVNGESTYPEELARPVNDGDELSILLVAAGG